MVRTLARKLIRKTRTRKLVLHHDDQRADSISSRHHDLVDKVRARLRVREDEGLLADVRRELVARESQDLTAHLVEHQSLVGRRAVLDDELDDVVL